MQEKIALIYSGTNHNGILREWVKFNNIKTQILFQQGNYVIHWEKMTIMLVYKFYYYYQIKILFNKKINFLQAWNEKALHFIFLFYQFVWYLVVEYKMSYIDCHQLIYFFRNFFFHLKKLSFLITDLILYWNFMKSLASNWTF